jgi:hypothetical protein
MFDGAGEATPAPTRPPLPVSGSLEYPEDYDPLAESANCWVTGTHQARHNILYRTAVFQIHDILVWIRIRGSMPLINGSGSGTL